MSDDTNNRDYIFLYDNNSLTQNPWTGTPTDDTYIYTGSDNFTGKGLAGNDTLLGGAGDVPVGESVIGSLRGAIARSGEVRLPGLVGYQRLEVLGKAIAFQKPYR